MPAPATEVSSTPRRSLGFRALRILVIVAVVLGIAWVVLSPLYDDEMPRVQANEGFVAVAGVMQAEAMFQQDQGRFPGQAEMDKSLLVPQPHVASVEFLPAGALRITYKGRHEIDSKTLTLTPYIDTSGVRWRCDMPDIKPRWWPDYCRPKPSP